MPSWSSAPQRPQLLYFLESSLTVSTLGLPGTGATTINYTYGDGIVLKSGGGTTGIYYVEYLAATPGRYKYTWEASGTIQAAFKSFFEVDDSRWS